MKRFTGLYMALDATTKTNAKVDALTRYFEQAPAADAAWALHVLLGRRLIRAVPSRRLRQWACEASGYPAWLLDECYRAVGDLSETLALLVPGEAGEPSDEALHAVIERRVLPLQHMEETEQREAIVATWARFDAAQCFLFHKLISQSFRVGVSAKLVTRALGRAAGVEPAVMAHRLTGSWRPTASDFGALLSGSGGRAEHDPAQPYPFCLASPLETEPAALGPIDDWQVEWKWDGIRAQLIHRPGATLVWSRGEELVGEAFPEARAIAQMMPRGTVVDAEILAWEGEAPLPFAILQRRIGRRNVQPMLFADVPIRVMAYDLLEAEGKDMRDRPLHVRRHGLASLIADLLERDRGAHVQLSPTVRAASWEALSDHQREARSRGVEGLMLKHRESPYQVGRVRGSWWKWKIEPHTIDAVMIAAQQGHGRRAGLFTDYTFGVWDGGSLVPVAKAYSGLTQKEIAEVDRFVRSSTTGRHGPVRTVEPRLVFEVAFEAVQESPRHKSGLALRFPRIARWRHDKSPADADTLDAVRRLLPEAMRSTR